jgi:hypothetical protein
MGIFVAFILFNRPPLLSLACSHFCFSVNYLYLSIYLKIKDPARVASCYEQAVNLDPSLASEWRKLAVVKEAGADLLGAAIALRGAADAFAGNSEASSAAEADLARVVVTALRGIMAPAEQGHDRSSSGGADVWWHDRAALRAILTGLSSARLAKPRHGPTLQLMASVTDRLARVPPAQLAGLMEDPLASAASAAAQGGSGGGSSSSGSSSGGRAGGGGGAAAENDGGNASAAMLLPLGLSPAQVQGSAVTAWRAAVAAEASTPDARIGLANALLVCAATLGATPSALLPPAEDDDDSNNSLNDDSGAVVVAFSSVVDSGGGAKASAMVREAVAQVEAAMDYVAQRRAKAKDNMKGSADGSSGSLVGGGGGGLVGWASTVQSSLGGGGSSTGGESGGSGGSTEGVEGEEDRVGTSALRLAGRWFLSQPYSDPASAARICGAVLGATSSTSSTHKAALGSLEFLAARATECGVALPDLVAAVGVHSRLFDHPTHAASARKAVQEMVLGLVSTGRSEDAAACTAQLNRQPSRSSQNAMGNNNSGGGGGAGGGGGNKKTRRAAAATTASAQQEGSGGGGDPQGGLSVDAGGGGGGGGSSSSSHGDLIGGSVADEVSAVGDQRRVEGHLVDAKRRYLRALNVQSDHIGAMTGLVAVAEALASGQTDAGPDEGGDLVKPAEAAAEKAADEALARQGMAGSAGAGAKLVAALPSRLLGPSKQAGLEVASLVLDRISSGAKAKAAAAGSQGKERGGGESGQAGSRSRRMQAIHLKAIELFTGILAAVDVPTILSAAPATTDKANAPAPAATTTEGSSDELTSSSAPDSSSSPEEQEEESGGVEAVLSLYERALQHIDEHGKSHASFGFTPAAHALDTAYVGAAHTMIQVTRALLTFATKASSRTAPSSSSKSNSSSSSSDKAAAVVAVGSERWSSLLALSTKWFSKLLGRLASRWSNVIVPRCVGGHTAANKKSSRSAISEGGGEEKRGEGAAAVAAATAKDDPSMPPRGAFALHLAEAQCYAGLMDVEEARLNGAFVLATEGMDGKLAGTGLELSSQTEQAQAVAAKAAAALGANPTAAALAEASDAANDALLDRLTIAIPGTSYAGVPVPVALLHLAGSDGPILGGWWTPTGLAGPGPMADAAEARALAKTLNLKSSMGHKDDGAGTTGGSQWGAARAAVAMDAFGELQTRALSRFGVGGCVRWRWWWLEW